MDGWIGVQSAPYSAVDLYSRSRAHRLTKEERMENVIGMAHTWPLMEYSRYGFRSSCKYIYIFIHPHIQRRPSTTPLAEHKVHIKIRRCTWHEWCPLILGGMAIWEFIIVTINFFYLFPDREEMRLVGNLWSYLSYYASWQQHWPRT